MRTFPLGLATIGQHQSGDYMKGKGEEVIERWRQNFSVPCYRDQVPNLAGRVPGEERKVANSVAVNDRSIVSLENLK